ncbi:MAG: T9SS type A sorting domain-containing protein [Bacteroidetes bacterium]|nr:MAG: T9SS type A sorting domain-containing protein [Bacteroidota bacterium]
MKKFLLIISVIIILFAVKLIAKDDIILSNQISSPTSFVQQPFDVLHYDVTADFSKFPSKEMSGICSITVRWLEKSDTNKFFFHLRSLAIDSCFYEGIKVVPEASGLFTSSTYHYEIPYQSQILKDTVIITIYYYGAMTSEPGTQSWGGVFSQSGILFSMGVGFYNNYVSATQHWMPCYDHPSDKAIFHAKFKVPKGKFVASIGVLKSQFEDSISVEYEWEHNFSCSTYLYTFAVADYVPVIISDDIPPVVVYSKPADTSKVKFVFKLLPGTIKAFERRFSKFPFEKAGYVITPFGSMEHETMVSYDIRVLRSYYNDNDSLNLVGAHELSHQWFGDYVTCRDFRDAWLNEGFASFCESIWLEDIKGWDSYLTHQQNFIQNYIGIYAADEGVFPLYDFPRDKPSSNYPVTIYYKGAAVLGMLRYELGDSIFFGAVKEYINRLGLGNSTSDTLQKICEEYSGKDLRRFFQQWVYFEGWPILEIHEAGSSVYNAVHINIAQIDTTFHVLYNNLPLEMKIEYVNDSVEYRMIDINGIVTTVDIDPAIRIKRISYNNGPSLRTLAEIHTTTVGVDDIRDISSNIIAYPNPANNYIRLLLKNIFTKAKLKIYNNLCDIVKELDFDTEKSNEMKLIDVSDLPAGVYFLVIYSGKDTDTVKFSVQH